MQPTVQSEQDKMVPIDTSGDPVEIEVKEDEKVNDNPEIEIQQDQSTEEKKEELDEATRRALYRRAKNRGDKKGMKIYAPKFRRINPRETKGK